MSSDMARLMELVSAHTGAGRLEPSALDRLAEIDVLAPDACRFEGGPLWRVMAIDAGPAEALRSGYSAEVPMRSFSCWSRDPVALMNVARHRFGEMNESQSLLLVRADVPAAARAIDIRAIFLETGLTDGVSWHAYANREQEVVLRHDAPQLEIRPEMVAGLWWAGDVDAVAPRVGETFSMTDGDLEIDHVGRAFNGGWVVTAGESDYLVHWEFGMLSGISHDPETETPEP